MTTLISSQRFLDADTVATKIAAGDFDVFVSPVFEVNGSSYQVVLDGHHSYAAAIEAGAEPSFTVMNDMQHDAIALLNQGEIEDFLTVTHMGDDYYDIATGMDVCW